MILDQVRKTVARYHMLSEGDCVIVGVSGGVDSVALLSILCGLRDDYGLSLVVAHLNHRLRGAESERDEGFVRKIARQFDLFCEVESIAVSGMKQRGNTLQEAAREARFLFFRRLLRKHRADKVALGQTADDQAETMVMRFLRGAGLSGLRGIPPASGEVIHPLIETRRAQLEDYLAGVGLDHVEDSSNRKDVYLRNRVRRHVVPFLEGYNPNLKENLVRMARVLWHEDQYLTRETDRVWRQMTRRHGETVCVELSPFRSLHPALQFRLLKRAVHGVSGADGKRVAAAHIVGLVNLAATGSPHSMINLPGGVIARRVYDCLEIRRGRAPVVKGFDVSVTLPGTAMIQEIGKKLMGEWVDTWDVRESSAQIAFLDADRLQPMLRVRNWRPGDRFRPLGMTGSKKIKDCFIDWKIPADQRNQIPLVVSANTIVWVVGHRISHDARVTAETKRVIRVEVSDLNHED